MGAYGVFRNGSAICGVEHGHCADVSGYGCGGGPDCLLDIVDSPAMDIETAVEPVFGIV